MSLLHDAAAPEPTPPLTQPAAGGHDASSGDTSLGVNPRAAAVLSYAGWWITGLVFLFLEREHRTVRFHAAQSLVIFGGLSVVMGLVAAVSATTLFLFPSLFRSIWALNWMVWLAGVVVWLVLIIQTVRGETWRVPIAADLADRIAGT